MGHSESVFENTVLRAERDAAGNPRAYRLRLLGFALLGYVVIFALLVALIGLIGGLAATAVLSTAAFLLLLKKKLIFVLVPAVWVIGRALWVRLEPPRGLAITAADAPALFAEIDALRRALDAPRVHEVIITPEMNAAIAQTPRFGLLGWQRNTLVLGLELLLTLSPEQARAVLAHEFGHLSGNHARFGGWIYRVRESWQRLMTAFDAENSFGGRLLARFFDWYAPRFAAYSFVLARSNEYEADAASKALTSSEAAGAALISTHVAGPWIDEHYWGEFFRQADEHERPPHLPWTGLAAFLGERTPSDGTLTNRLDAALAEETGHADTHPALKDRLAALGTEPQIPAPARQNAAELWLSDSCARVLETFDDEWYAHNEEHWRERYEYVQTGRQRLAELNRRARDRALDDDDLWQQARLTEELESGPRAYPLYLAYQQRNPEDADAAFVLGRLLYDRDDEQVVPQMRKALASPVLAVEACQYAYHYLMRHDRQAEAEWFQQEAQARLSEQQESEAERAHLAPDDPLQPSGIASDLREQIVEQLRASPLVRRAWLAEKPMQHHPEVPALAIAITPAGWHLNEERLAATLSDAFDFNGCTWFVVPKAGDYTKLARHIIKAGERIL